MPPDSSVGLGQPLSSLFGILFAANTDDLVCARMGSVGGTGQWVRVTDSGHRPSEFEYQLRHHPAVITGFNLVRVLMGMCVWEG